MDRNVEMCLQIQRALYLSRALVQPAVYIRSDVDKILCTKLRDIVKRHQGNLVERPEEATHVVHRPPNYRDEEEAVRAVLRRERGCLLHWWHAPDSYDLWLPDMELEEAEPQGEATTPAPEGQAWQVNALFVLDLEEFNEWMNEEDYLVPGTERGRPLTKYTLDDLVPCPEAERRRGGDKKGKRKRSPSPPPSDRKKRKGRGGQTPSAGGGKGKRSAARGEEEEDLTKDMDDPVAEPNITEVALPKSGQIRDSSNVMA